MQAMKNPRVFYAVILVAVYALLWFVGNGFHGAEARWQDEAAPWLGEAPADLQVQTLRAASAEQLPCSEFTLAADTVLQQKIIATFGLEPTAQGDSVVYTGKGVLPMYPADYPMLPNGLSAVFSPRLTVLADGTMLFCPDDANATKDESVARKLAPVYPQYLPQSPQWEVARGLMLAVLCFLLPGALCCVGWLWVQRRAVADGNTPYICYFLPAVVAFLGAYADFYVHGYDASYAMYSAVFSTLTNVACAFVLVLFTKIFRGR